MALEIIGFTAFGSGAASCVMMTLTAGLDFPRDFDSPAATEFGRCFCGHTVADLQADQAELREKGVVDMVAQDITRHFRCCCAWSEMFVLM